MEFERLRVRALGVLMPLALAAFAPVAAQAKGGAETRYARVEHACSGPTPGRASCFALVRRPVPGSEAGKPGVHPFVTAGGAAASGPAGGLTPADIATAYGYEASTGGSGQTVGIVDAFDDPTIESDLGAFDTEYSLPACTEANGCFEKVGQTGKTNVLPAADTTGWSVEISLDVEAVHAVCPKCHILLVEATNPEFTNLAEATNTAVALGATEVSNSYGGPEAKVPAAEAAYNHPGVVIAAATGDVGWDSWAYFNEFIVPPKPPRPDIPATLPSVVSVGGTSLSLNASAKRLSETVWNGNGPDDSSEFDEGATGGGCSTIYTAQRWQEDAPGYPASGCAGKRLDADVAAVADPLTGFDIYDTYNCGSECERFKNGAKWMTIGGTSLATPLISAMYGLAGGAQGVSYPALTLYGHLGGGSVFDVTEGGNGYCDDGGGACGVNAKVEQQAKSEPALKGVKLDCEGTTACNAATGFDGPSGVGTPASLSLFEPLLPTASIDPPAKVVTNVSASFAGSASSDPYPGGTLTYAWTFGDGATGSGPAPSHTYTTTGERTVTLSVTDSYGLKSALKSVQVDVVERTAQELKEEEAAAKKKAEEEAAAKKKAEEEAAAKKKAEEEAAAKKKAEEEAAAKKKAEEEAAAKKKAEEEAASKKKAEEEAASKKKAEEEAAAKKNAEEEAAKRKAAEALKALEEVAARVKAAEEAAARVKAAEEAAKAKGGVSGFTAVSPDATLVGKSLQAAPNGTFTVKIACPAGETSCEGSVTVQTAGAVVTSAKARVLTLATGSFKVAGGKVATVKLHLTRQARSLLARKHSLRVRVKIAAHDPAGATHTGQAIASLRATKKHG